MSPFEVLVYSLAIWPNPSIRFPPQPQARPVRSERSSISYLPCPSIPVPAGLHLPTAPSGSKPIARRTSSPTFGGSGMSGTRRSSPSRPIRALERHVVRRRKVEDLPMIQRRCRGSGRPGGKRRKRTTYRGALDCYVPRTWPFNVLVHQFHRAGTGSRKIRNASDIITETRWLSSDEFPSVLCSSQR